MRAWYTDRSGLRADLCLLLNRETTRLIIRDASGRTIDTRTYPSWADAISALSGIGTGWVSDITGKPLN